MSEKFHDKYLSLYIGMSNMTHSIVTTKWRQVIQGWKLSLVHILLTFYLKIVNIHIRLIEQCHSRWEAATPTFDVSHFLQLSAGSVIAPPTLDEEKNWKQEINSFISSLSNSSTEQETSLSKKETTEFVDLPWSTPLSELVKKEGSGKSKIKLKYMSPQVHYSPVHWCHLLSTIQIESM